MKVEQRYQIKCLRANFNGVQVTAQGVESKENIEYISGPLEGDELHIGQEVVITFDYKDKK